MKKRLISWLLCVTILVGLLPGTAIFALASEPDAETVSDEYISVSVSRKNGGFTIRTAEGDRLKKSDNNKKLLYHDGQYDTSFLSLRIGEGENAKDYLFGGEYPNSGAVTVTRATAGDSISAVWTVDGMTVTQTVTLANQESDESGMVAIGVTVTNGSGAAVPVAARLLLDTSLGEQDYGFYQYTDSNHNTVTVQQERVIDGADNVPQQLYAADDVYSPAVMAYSIHTGERPYRAAFGHWNHLAATLFDFKPSTNLDFTDSGNEYLTEDSAVAFYYDMGTVASGQSGVLSTYYGVFSNHQIPAEDSVAINLTAPTRLKLNDAKDGFVSECNVGEADFSVAVDFANIKSDTAKELKQVVLAVQCGSNLRSLNDYGQPMADQDYETADAHTYSYQNVAVGQSIGKTLYFDARVSNDAKYERIIIGVYDVSQTGGQLSETYKLGERIVYILLPGSDGNVPKVNFAAMTPKIIYNQGTRHLFVTVGNETMLKDEGNWNLKAYREKENNEDDRQTESILIPHTNISINDGVMDVALTEDMKLADGGWYLQLEWDSGAVGTLVPAEDAKQSAPELHFTVSNDKQYKNDSYGVLAIVEYDGDNGNPNKKTYKIRSFRNETDFNTFKVSPASYENGKYGNEYSEIVFVFKGEFTATKKNGNVGTYYTAVSTKEKKDGKWVVDNSIVINDCLDFEDGTMTVYYEDYDDGVAPYDSAVCTEFDGKLYTNKERTSVWTGRAAITKLEQNEANYSLAPYDENGERISVEKDQNGKLKAGDEANFTDEAICLMWPSVAKIGQTLAGLLVHLMYGQFGRMYDTDGYGNIEENGEIGTVISFAAALDLTFASDVGPGQAPDTYWSRMKELWEECRDESPYVCQEDFKTYFNAQNWSTVDEKAEDKTKQEAKASVAVRDILFGCGKGFVGVNFTVGVTIANYVRELPGIEGTISVNTVNNWSYGIDGKIDLEVFCVEATVSFRSKNNVPVPDEFYVFVSGFEPGLNIDGMGVCWITGGGGGIKNLYDTIFSTKKVPPLKLLLSVSFDIIKVLECKKATLSLGATGIGISAEEIGIKVLPGFTAIEKMGLSLEWYPGIDMRANIVVNLFDGVIYGGGYMILLSSDYKNYFFEMFARAQLRVPASVPVAGGMSIGGADLGISTEKIWGAIDVLFITLGVTYYWGESGVDFSSGSKTQPTFPELLGYEDIPIGYNTESGQTLYARVGTNTQLAASNLEDNGGLVLMNATSASVKSDVNKQKHTLTLGQKDSGDALVQIAFDADSEEDAKKKAAEIKVGSSEGAADYELTLYYVDPVTEIDNLDEANANLTYNPDTKRATYAFTVTKDEDYGKTWYLTTPEGSDVLLYNVAAVPEVTKVGGTVSNNSLGLTWEGKELSELDKISFYLCESNQTDGSDAGYRIGAIEDAKTLAGGSCTLTPPEDVPSGEYYLRAVYSKSDEVNGVVFSESKLKWENVNTPKAELLSARASGDLQYTVTVKEDAKTDGYLVTVYDEDGAATDFERVAYTAAESGDTVITVGGFYTAIDPEDNTKTKTYGLTGNKSYVIGVTPYHTVVQGNGELALYGAEVKTDTAVYLPLSVTPNVTFSADQAARSRTTEEYGMTAGGAVGMVDVSRLVYTTDTLTLTAKVSEAVSGSWSIDDGDETSFDNTDTVTIPLSGLQEGEHTVSINGEAADGDGFSDSYTFVTDTLPPQLLLASPVNGSFFKKDGTVTLSGTCDSDARFTVTCDGEIVCDAQPIKALGGTINAVGEFAVTLSLPNPNSASQRTLEIAVSDDVGNATESIRITLSHGALADIAELDVMVNGKLYSNGNIPIPTAGLSNAELTLVGTTEAGTRFNLTGYNVDWEVRAVEGSAEVNDGSFTAEAMSQGILIARLAVADRASRSASLSFGASAGKTVAVSSGIGGSVSGGGEYEAGTTVTLTATPDSGYHFAGWTLLGVSGVDTSSATLTFIMPDSGNVTAEARFEANPSPSAPSTPSGGGSSGGGASSGSVIGKGRYAQKGETVEVGLPNGKSEEEYLPYYYSEDKTKIFVPISAAADGKMKFIAPVSGQYFFGSNEVSFNDIGGRWSESNILFAAQRGIFKGTGGGGFEPEGAMDRAMVATVLYRLAGSPSVSGVSSYTDATQGSWYYDAVLWGEEKGIIKGYGDGIFGVNDVITREQLCTMLMRFCDVMNYSLPTAGESEAFADADAISDWAKEAVDYCKTRGLVNGLPNGAFAPTNTCTREECSAVMERMLRSLLENK